MKKNNKGAAMVSVLIACLFIAILAGSLLVMATMNMISKSMRYQGTDNFYTSEFALADLSTALQNIAAQYDTVPVAASHLQTAVGKGSSGSVTYWTPASVQGLIVNATKESNITIAYGTKYDPDGDGTPNTTCYQETSDSLTLLGVQITSVDDKGNRSVITTDIKLNFQAIAGEMDINQFSIITDSPVNAYGHSLLLSGHVYIGHGTAGSATLDANGSYGVTALTVGSTSKSTNVYIMNKGIISGDIVVNSGSVLDISGEVTVYGKITVEPGGTLLVSGKLRHTGDVIRRSGSIVRGFESGNANNNSISGQRDLPTTGIDGDRLAHALLVDITSKDGSFSVSFTAAESAVDYRNSKSTSIGGTTFYLKMGNQMHNLLNGGDFDNCLILTSKPLNMKTYANNCTVVTEGAITYNDEFNGAYTYMTHLSDEEYEALKALQFDGGFGGYNFETSSVFPPTGSNYEEIVISDPNLLAGKDGRSIYKNTSSGKYVVPIGYFISEDSKTIISSAFAATMGEQDPKDSYCIYYNWDKE